MYGQFINELDKFSVGRYETQLRFEYLTYARKLDYVLKNNLKNTLQDPLSLSHLNYDDTKSNALSNYEVDLETEKEQINKRFLNLQYLGKMNSVFEQCRSVCRVPDSRLRNIGNYGKDHQSCITDCLNVRTEELDIKKPDNDLKTFVWLA